MKTVTIKWKDGSRTKITVKADTDVLAAYKPVLAHIKWIIATNIETHETERLYADIDTDSEM